MDHIVLGVSLGGHAAWQCLLAEPRISAGVVIIGCPDYVRLMLDRAAKSKLPTWTESDPPGASFLGSKDFPPSLLKAVSICDPMASLQSFKNQHPTASDHLRLWLSGAPFSLGPVANGRFTHKKILNVAGGADKLVPYSCCEPFLNLVKAGATSSSTLIDTVALKLQDIVYDGVGHEMTPPMVEDAVKFVLTHLHARRQDDMETRRSSL